MQKIQPYIRTNYRKGVSNGGTLEKGYGVVFGSLSHRHLARTQVEGALGCATLSSWNHRFCQTLPDSDVGHCLAILHHVGREDGVSVVPVFDRLEALFLGSDQVVSLTLQGCRFRAFWQLARHVLRRTDVAGSQLSEPGNSP